MQSLRSEVQKVWDTVTDPETTTAYQAAGEKTWLLTKQLSKLVLLLTLFVTAIALWLWMVSFQSGRSLRHWLETEQPSLPQILTKAGELLIAPVKPVLGWIQAQIKTQLGVDINFLPPADITLLNGSSEQASTQPQLSPGSKTAPSSSVKANP
jgi:hypothetical protein